MRPTPIVIGICLALSGCQALGPACADRLPRTEVQHLRPVSVNDSVATSGAAPSRPLTVMAVQQAQHVEPLPVIESDQASGTQNRPQTSGETSLTLGELEEMALSANPSVARANALVQAAAGNWVQVGLPPNPSVGYEGQQIGSRGLAEQDGVFVEQEIIRGGKLRLSREVAAYETLRTRHQLAAQQQRVLTDVRIAFYQVLIAERQEQLAGELRDSSAEAVKVAEALLKGLEVGRVDTIQAQLELGNAEILAENAINRYIAAWRNLSTVVGYPGLSPQPLKGDIDELGDEHTWETSRDHLLSSSPEIAAAMAEIERSRWALERACVEKIPNVTVQGLVNWRDNGIGGRSDGGITVGVPLPVWNRNQGAIAQAQSQAAAAERALRQLELSLENRLAPVYERYSNALNQVNKRRSQLLPAAKEALDLSRRLYQAGETPYLTLLTAQRTFSQTNLNYLESLRELRLAEAEIEGLLLSNSLEVR